MSPLAGRVALVTGAAGAIGSATAEALARQGADVVLGDLSPLAPLEARLRELGRQVIAAPLDVTHQAEVDALVARAEEGLGRLDILVNVAGTVSWGAAATLAEAEWRRVLDINLTGSFLCCQAVIPLMRRGGHGRIVNIGSLVGKNGGNARPWLDPAEQARAGNVAYGVSKAGIHAMTAFLARELAADGITVNAVAPGPIATGMTTELPASLRALIPVGRMGRAEEVAAVIAFLAGPQAGFITGEVLDINGGMWND